MKGLKKGGKKKEEGTQEGKNVFQHSNLQRIFFKSAVSIFDIMFMVEKMKI